MTTTAPTPLLEITNLCLSLPSKGRPIPILRDISLTIAPGERLALVGESGCGKSMACLSITRLPPTDRASVSGSLSYNGRNIGLEPSNLKQLRGSEIAYVFQDPTTGLNPVMRIGPQIYECLRMDGRKQETTRRLEESATRLLDSVNLPDPSALLRAFPCELSGGMQQRVMLAMALASRPRLLIADEPTTALDVTTQAEVLDLIEGIVAENKMALLLVTHNLGLVARRCQTVHVLYAGQIVESGPVEQVLKNPAHPYTQGLLRAIPTLGKPVHDLQDIPGNVPRLDNPPAGCAFAPRCPYRTDRCASPPQPRSLGAARVARCHHPLYRPKHLPEGAP